MRELTKEARVDVDRTDSVTVATIKYQLAAQTNSNVASGLHNEGRKEAK
jgi:hypothetical protein